MWVLVGTKLNGPLNETASTPQSYNSKLNLCKVYDFSHLWTCEELRQQLFANWSMLMLQVSLLSPCADMMKLKQMGKLKEKIAEMDRNNVRKNLIEDRQTNPKW
jgi:hypothetical protein